MAYTVLARRYRSQGFDDVVGQDAIAQTLRNAIQSGRVAHAYLFTGTRGVGKTTMARILAKSLNCLSVDSPTIEPCCECESCISINTGDDIDVIEIDGASNNGVDNIRELRQNAIYRPARSRYKIYIIDEIHMLSTGAFNALLKILEEPPEHVKFIFATTEPNKVLPTIQSRCQRFDFKAIDPDSISSQLKTVLEQENVSYEEDAIITLSRLANGSMRDSLSLLDQVISSGIQPLTAQVVQESLGEPSREKIAELVKAIGSQDAAMVLEQANKMLIDGMTCVQIMDALIEYFRDLMVIKAGAQKVVILTPTEQQLAKEASGSFDIASLVYNIATLEKMRWTVKNADNPRALLEAIMIRMSMSENFINVPDLMSKVASGGAFVKKNSLDNSPSANRPGMAAASRPSVRKAEPQQEVQITKISCDNIDSLKSNWKSIVSQISAKFPMIGTSLSVSVPASFEGSKIVVAFGSTCAFQKKMCESNGNLNKIQDIISEIIDAKVIVNLEISNEVETPERKRSKGAGTSRREVEEILSDTRVKTLIDGLKARVMKIED